MWSLERRGCPEREEEQEEEIFYITGQCGFISVTLIITISIFVIKCFVFKSLKKNRSIFVI